VGHPAAAEGTHWAAHPRGRPRGRRWLRQPADKSLLPIDVGRPRRTNGPFRKHGSAGARSTSRGCGTKGPGRTPVARSGSTYARVSARPKGASRGLSAAPHSRLFSREHSDSGELVHRAACRGRQGDQGARRVPGGDHHRCRRSRQDTLGASDRGRSPAPLPRGRLVSRVGCGSGFGTPAAS
jgi:hypothetical protein